MTLQDRIDNYHKITGFPQSLWLGGDSRIADKQKVLHLFAGKVDTAVFPGVTVDINANLKPDIVDDAHTLTKVPLEDFDLVLADPAYSCEDTEHYGTPMVNRNLVVRTLGQRLRKGCHVVWLDQVLPMYRKDTFNTQAHIGMVKSTNHRLRVVTVFGKL